MSNVALIAGATGLVGGSLLELLLKGNRYEKVISLQRGHALVSHPRLVTIQTDFTNLHELILPNVTDVFCCLGTTIKQAGSKEQFKKVDYTFPLALAQCAAKLHAKDFLIVTSMGANAASIFFYNKVKGELEEELTAFKDVLTISVLRPSLLLGNRVKKRMGESAGIILAQGINKVFKTDMGTKSTDVSKAMYILATDPKPKGISFYSSTQIKKIAASA